jgi:hypothetical protein
MSAPALQQSDTFERTADALLRRFERLWHVRDAELIREIVAADATSYWSGLGEIKGSDYPERWHALVNDSVDQLEFRITGHAAQEPYLFISWHVRATAANKSVETTGSIAFASVESWPTRSSSSLTPLRCPD